MSAVTTRGTIHLDVESCKGCELCVSACPQQILGMGKKINNKGYFYAEVNEHGRLFFDGREGR